MMNFTWFSGAISASDASLKRIISANLLLCVRGFVLR
jgi:hypothetical protein